MSKSKPDKKAEPEKDAPQDGGWRETIESIAMAVVLALLFRGFVAEAFVIPTGSMAPTLQGRHKDVWCPKCGQNYQVSCSPEQKQDTGTPSGFHVVFATCPICQYTQRLDPIDKPNDGSFSGDRIIVAKFAYDLTEPKRWDVIVFKYPGGATQNYIKRLIGLPNELVRIVGGNIQTCRVDASDPDQALRIVRKPPHKLSAMLQKVDDTDHIPQELIDLGWPARWQAWPPGESAWQAQNGGRAFLSSGERTDESWLRYRHLVPTAEDWAEIDRNHTLPAGVNDRSGQLISDFYAYNTEQPVIFSPETVSLWRSGLLKSYQPPIQLPPGDGPGDPPPPSSLGQHWVDDLALECLAEVTSKQGELSLLLVRGGLKYFCRINLADGKATLSMVDYDGKELQFDGVDENTGAEKNPVAQTSVKGPGHYRLKLTNCDHELLLWVNGSVMTFDGPTTYPSPDLLEPYYTAEEPGDLAPAGIGVKQAGVRLSSLRIYRDKYYIATRGDGDTTDYVLPPRGVQTVLQVFRDPALWTSSGLFYLGDGEQTPGNRRQEQFALHESQFLPLGDNSPASSDGRFWSARVPGFAEDHHYVERDLLIGKALVIYWPHTWNRPIPFLPNFRKMGPIR